MNSSSGQLFRQAPGTSLKEAANCIRKGLDTSRSLAHGCLGPFVEGVGRAFQAVGIDVDRVNLPAAKDFGFHHPIHLAANITWTRASGINVHYMTHSAAEEYDGTLASVLKGSPYYSLVQEGATHFRAVPSSKSNSMPLLAELAAANYEDYLALPLYLPNGAIQPISIAKQGQFQEGVIECAALLQPLLSTAVDALYQGSAAAQLAAAYIGPQTGPRVLKGEFTRGNTQSVRAGILFCDIRGFTALSEKLGAEGIVPIVNQVFDIVGDCVTRNDGEILKFIGDAVLSVFPTDDLANCHSTASSMILAVRESIEGVQALAKELGLPLAIGFGGHIGDVLYGNIGTESRFDFTIMGPAVNLASRLEGLCKQFNSPAIFSEDLGTKLSEDLAMLGTQTVKGVAEPIQAWGFR
jgi:adenylate cyclase